MIFLRKVSKDLYYRFTYIMYWTQIKQQEKEKLQTSPGNVLRDNVFQMRTIEKM